MKKLFISVLVLLPMLVISQTGTENYVKSTSYQIETLSDNVTENQKQETVSYYDGLGRPKQTIGIRAGGDKQDLITPLFYDDLGRQPKDYLPLPLASNNGNYVISPLTSLEAFYFNNFEGDRHPWVINPYSEKRFEASPLNRVLEIGAPGMDWKINSDPDIDTDHTVKFDLTTNTTSDQVRLYLVTFLGGNTEAPKLEKNVYYSPNQLYKTITKDENWQSSDGNNHTVQEFKNKLGQVILKRSFNNNAKHDTYYVYDDYGNLTYVLSPEASELINSTIIHTEIDEALDKLGYQYKYDYRNRLIEKKIPGKEWEYIVYNKLNMPAFTQDANLRTTNHWLFTKYDALGRVVYTGKNIYTGTREDLQSLMNNTSYLFEERSTAIQINNETIYYTTSVFPTANNYDIYTVNYYDDYIDSDNLSVPTTVYGETTTNNLQGLPTVSKIRVLDPSNTGQADWITTISGYDHKARLIYTASKNNYLGTTDVIKTQLDFSGKILESTTTHLKDSNPIITTLDYFTYDHMGRIITHEQQIDSSPIQLIYKNHYDEIGQLIKKDVGGETFVDGYTDLNGVDVSVEGTVEKTGGSNIYWDAALKTRGKIMTEGGVSFKVITIKKGIKGGFYKTGQALDLFDTLHYGIICTDEPVPGTNDEQYKVKYIENGQPTDYASVNYKVDDVFKVERISTGPNTYKVEYSKNNDLPFRTANNVLTNVMLGKAVFKKIGGKIEDFNLFGANIDKILQEVDYKYNIRGWLTNINNVDVKTEEKSLDLFNFRINYNKPEDLINGTPLYNGNISQTIWRTKNDQVKRDYLYNYDNLNRITGATGRQGENLDVSNSTDLQNVSYDRNGNILTLKRYGFDDLGLMSGMWDNLTYTYQGNQLQKVSEPFYYSLREYGFKDGINTGDDYGYDDNGNMTMDENKGITSIAYNHLNLPEVITINNVTDTGSITYIYDATGVKLKKTFKKNTDADKHTEYAGNYLYSDNESVGSMQLEFFNHSEGYIVPVAGTTKSVKGYKEEPGGGTTTYSGYSYVFQYKDHLGNVRLSYSDSDLDGAIAQGEIIEESNYYPFGLKQKGYNNVVEGGNSLAQQWKYNGKEFNEDLDIDWYDFGARNIDPALGRWFNVDNMSEDYFEWSPYTYTLNNPIYFIDPDGNQVDDLWSFNVDTGKLDWVSDLGGADTQIVQVTNNNGDALGSGAVAGNEVHVATLENSVFISSYDATSDIPGSYNANSGYNYDGSDLKARHAQKEQGGVFWGLIQKAENRGNADAVYRSNGVQQYVNQWGTNSSFYYGLEHYYGPDGASFADDATRMLKGQGKNISAGLSKSKASFGSLNGRTNAFSASGATAKGSSGSISKSASGGSGQTKQLKSSWNQFLSNNKGTYSGKGWIKKASADYKRLKSGG
mgnify:CR=1 FL=1